MTLFTPFNIVIFGLWFLSALADYSEFCYLWQLKEYRLDRMRDFFSTKQGQNFWLGYPLLIRSFVAFIIFFWPMNEIPMLKGIILLGFTIDLLYNLIRFIRHQIRHPRFTAKALLLIGIALAFNFILPLLTRDWSLVILLFITRFFIFGAMVIIVNYVTDRIKEWYIYQATQKIKNIPQLTVIGITGSYGKSSVKEYVSQIVGEKYKIIQTPGNTNTDIGIAQFILRTDFTGAQIFVVEMGAYRIGEIKKICTIVRPRIGILTAIIEQHLSLFGSIENIQTAKYELLRSIPENGFILTNADNFYCTQFLSELPCKNIETFGEEAEHAPNFYILEVTTHNSGISWKNEYQGQLNSWEAPLLGAHQASNCAPAIMVGKYLGLTNEEINHSCLHLRGGSHALTTYKYGKAFVIDDSYNSNPRGFRAALEILSSYPSALRRIVITRGMLELGDRSEEVHTRLSEEIAFYADELLVITPDFTEYFETGVRSLHNKYRLDIKPLYDPRELLHYIKELCNQEVVILLESKIPSIVYQEIHGI